MDPQLARAILNEAKSGGFLDGTLPEGDSELVKEAQYFLEEARKAKDAGMEHPTVTAIIALGEGQEVPQEEPQATEDQSGSDPAPDPPAAQEESTPERREIPAEAWVAPEVSVEASEAPNTASESDTQEITPDVLASRERLPVPSEIEGEPLPMPRDLSTVNDRMIRRLSGEYNAFLARAKWVLTNASVALNNTRHLRDAAFRQAFIELDRIDPETEKAKTAGVLETEANADERVVVLDQRVADLEAKVTTFKALAEIYSKNVEVLSREWTMRQDEFLKTK